MASTSKEVQNGFRTLLRVLCDDETQIKCYIYLDFNKMKIIKDIEDHIKSILDVYPISLFVDDIWLPSSETVHLIKKDDTLFVKKTAIGQIISGSSPNKVDIGNDGPVEKKRKKMSETGNASNGDQAISLEHLYKELQNKKNALVQKNDKAESSTVDKASQNDDDEGGFFLASKKKRIRKHKKKTVIKIAPPRPEIITSSSENVAVKPSQQPIHKRFEVDVDSSTALFKEIVSKLTEPRKSNDSENKDKDVPERTPSIYIAPEVKEQLLCNTSSDLASLNTTAATSSVEPKVNVPTENGESKEKPVENSPVAVPSSSINETKPIDWKTKLLSLAAVNEKESKTFHRKQPISKAVSCFISSQQDTTPVTKST